MLYEHFHLDEPWDSEHNRSLLKYMPDVFRCPVPEANVREYETYYQSVTGEGTAFPPNATQGTRLRDFLDGLANTILIVEGSESVPWTKPIDLVLNKEGSLPPLGGPFAEGFFAAVADGQTYFVFYEKIKSLEDPRVLFYIADGHSVNLPELLRR